MKLQFRDRADAGKQLAKLLLDYCHRPELLVLALPRGGVPVGFEVAQALNAPLDVFVVRKVGVPGQEELAMGAIASGGVRVLNNDVIDMLGITGDVIDDAVRREFRELERREKMYRAHPLADVHGRTIILVDDGVATGATIRAAVKALRQLQPASIVVAAPVVAESTADELKRESELDELVAVITPVFFMGVGDWYRDFSQTTDEDVRKLLRQPRRRSLAYVRDEAVLGAIR